MWLLGPSSAVRPRGRGVSLRDSSGLRASVDRCVDAWPLLLLLALCLVASQATMADQFVPAGGRTVINSGLLDLACTDLYVAGVIDTGSGVYVNVRNVTVASSGTIQGSGSIHYSGALSVAGTVTPSVSLIVNPASDPVCPGPARAEVIPTLGNSMLAALAMLLLGLAASAVRVQKMRSAREDWK